MAEHHYIGEDLAGWVALYVAIGLAQMERYLAKQAAFSDFLEQHP